MRGARLQKLRYFDEAGEKNKKSRQSTKGAAIAQTERTSSYKEDQKMLEVVREVRFGPQIAWDKQRTTMALARIQAAARALLTAEGEELSFNVDMRRWSALKQGQSPDKAGEREKGR